MAIEEAQAARVVAEEASATKSAFLSSVSHELRTPLTSVVGFSRLIRRRLDDVVFPAVPTGEPKRDRAMRQVSDNLGIIIEEGERLTALINDTLDLAKIEAGRMEWRREPVDVGEVIARATAATASLLDGSGPAMEVDVAADLPPVLGDRDRLIQVVINLISNAVKFTPSGTITCSASSSADDGRAIVLVSVADTGVGIAPRIRRGSSSSSARPATPSPTRPVARASACPSAARSSSTTAAGCGSTRRSGAGRGSRSRCRSRQPEGAGADGTDTTLGHGQPLAVASPPD